MIKKITMHNVASYKNMVSLETDKKINLLYGLNGTGKSTLSDYLYNRHESKFKDCSVEGIGVSDEILVYNQQFIRDNFYETENIPGIFTLSKENKEIKKIIDDAKKHLSDLIKEKDNLEIEKKKIIFKYEKDIQEYQNVVWKIKTDFSGGDRVLEYCLDGLKANKNTLFNYLTGLDNGFQDINYTIEDLKREAIELESGGVKESTIDRISIDVDDIEKSELLKKVIVGNKNSTVANLIEKLNNSDWVNKGLDYVDNNEEPATCPFCQQKTITKGFLEQIEEYFDKSYQEDKARLDSMMRSYVDKTSILIANIEKLEKNKFIESNQKKSIYIY